MERRKSERLELSLPVTISFADNLYPIKLLTKDISSGGVFIETDHNLPLSTKVLMEIQLTPLIANKTDQLTFVKLKGQVLRATDQGMAIQFLEDQFFFRA